MTRGVLFSRNSAALALVVRAVALLAPLAIAPLLARGLGPAGRGEAGAMISAIMLLPVLLNCGTSVVLKVAAATDSPWTGAALRGMRSLAAVGAGLTVLTLVFAQSQLVNLLGTGPTTSFSISLPVCVFFGILWIGNASVLVGRGENLLYAVTLAVPSVAYASFIFVLWLAGSLTVERTLWGQVFSYAVTFAVSSFFVRTGFRGARESVTSLVRRGRRYVGGQVAESASYRLDQVLILPLLGAAPSGLYAVAVTISFLPTFAAQVIAAAAFRQSSQDLSRIENTDRGILIRLTMLVGIGVGGALALVCGWLIVVVFGEDFSGAIEPTLVGLGGALFLAVGQGCATLLAVQERGWLITAAQCSGLALSIALIFALSPIWGVVGFALASALGYVASTCVMLFGLRLNWRELIPRLSDLGALVRVFSNGRY